MHGIEMPLAESMKAFGASLSRGHAVWCRKPVDDLVDVAEVPSGGIEKCRGFGHGSEHEECARRAGPAPISDRALNAASPSCSQEPARRHPSFYACQGYEPSIGVLCGARAILLGMDIEQRREINGAVFEIVGMHIDH
jgi:hypothetical protein